MYRQFGYKAPLSTSVAAFGRTRICGKNKKERKMTDRTGSVLAKI
jgi:hypothetical protein